MSFVDTFVDYTELNLAWLDMPSLPNGGHRWPCWSIESVKPKTQLMLGGASVG